VSLITFLGSNTRMNVIKFNNNNNEKNIIGKLIWLYRNNNYAANIAFVITPEALIVPDSARHSSQFSISNKGRILLPTKLLLLPLPLLILLLLGTPTAKKK